MRIVFISDTHNKLAHIVVPDGDVLVHCGDFSGRGTEREIEMFNSDLAKLPHEHKVVVAGNHDFLFERSNVVARAMLDNDITYLEDDGCEIDGVKFYGSPWQPEFFNWAFNLPRNGEGLKARWDAIPTDVDVLITHGPPYGILDRIVRGALVGCELLRKRVDELKPRVHCFGHIHEAYGVVQTDTTLFLNASNLDKAYNVANKPIVVDLNDTQVTLIDPATILPRDR